MILDPVSVEPELISTGEELVKFLKSYSPDEFEDMVRQAGKGRKPFRKFKFPTEKVCFDMDMTFELACEIMTEFLNACAYQKITIDSIEDVPKNPAQVILHFKKL